MAASMQRTGTKARQCKRRLEAPSACTRAATATGQTCLMRPTACATRWRPLTAARR